MDKQVNIPALLLVFNGVTRDMGKSEFLDIFVRNFVATSWSNPEVINLEISCRRSLRAESIFTSILTRKTSRVKPIAIVPKPTQVGELNILR